jgi:hypothetical protein
MQSATMLDKGTAGAAVTATVVPTITKACTCTAAQHMSKVAAAGGAVEVFWQMIFVSVTFFCLRA